MNTLSSEENLCNKKSVIIFSLASILFIYTAVIIFYLYPREAIRNLDFWYHISLGYQMDWNEPHTLVNGLYPLGYPFLLYLASQLGVDALRVGQFLSWIGGVLLLSACFLFIHLLTRHLILAITGTLLLFFNIHFLTFVTYEGNDMIAAGLQAMAIVLLLYGIKSETPDTFSKFYLMLHGVLLGCAYLTRYTALLFLPISIAYLILFFRHSPKRMLQAIAWAIVPFLIVTSVQWIPSLLVHGNLFYNEQAKNVWFGIYGGGDWVKNWGKVPKTIGLTEVIAEDPARFLQHWLFQIRVAVLNLYLWPLPLHLAWIIALPILLFYRGLALSHRILLLMLLIFPLSVTALAWLAPRFLLVSLWVEAILIAWLIFYLVRISPLNKYMGAVLVSGILLLIMVSFQWRGIADWWSTPQMARQQEVNDFLRTAGMVDPERTATNDPYLHAVDESDRTRYAQTYAAHASPDQVEALLAHPAASNWQYLVMDYQNGFGEYRPIREALRQEKSRLIPLALSDNRDVFCIAPCDSQEIKELNLIFENGMELLGYRWHETDIEGALYLYWQIENELTHSYKVSVRVIDALGNEVVQLDNIPQLWTFPTVAWSPNTPIVDFYSWQLENECEECTVSVVVYDENSLVPLLATTQSGQQVGPLIDLTYVFDLSSQE